MSAPPAVALPPATAGVRLRRGLLRAAFAAARVWWFVRRPHTHGVKLLLRSGPHLLLVRHSYGHPTWELPGGGARRGEQPAQTASREAREELGLEIAAWHPVGSFVDRDRATAHLTCLTADVGTAVVAVDGAELRDAAWWPVDELPSPLGHLAVRALALTAVPPGRPAPTTDGAPER